MHSSSEHSSSAVNQTKASVSQTRPQNSTSPTNQAALAISGQTRANEEMPYMTPPNLQVRYYLFIFSIGFYSFSGGSV